MTKRKKKSSPAKSVWFTLLGFSALAAVVYVLLRGKDVMLLNPKGYVASQQLRLLITATLVMLIIGIPTLFILYFFAWRYRETNEKAMHIPNKRESKLSAFGIWAFPLLIAVILGAILVPATHKLEPQKPLNHAADPLKIQVVAMRWKWLFIYPEENIATVNYVQIPVDKPVQFELTADETPMSSFWIPHLGGQLYAMTEHVNRLNLQADEMGDFEGSVAEINGAGFAEMRFNTRVSSEADYKEWIKQVQSAPQNLSAIEYKNLLTPSKNNPPAFYANPAEDLYSTIVGKYAGAHEHSSDAAEHEGHE